jgi:hypothetical protein
VCVYLPKETELVFKQNIKVVLSTNITEYNNPMLQYLVNDFKTWQLYQNTWFLIFISNIFFKSTGRKECDGFKRKKKLEVSIWGIEFYLTSSFIIWLNLSWEQGVLLLYFIGSKPWHVTSF